MRTHNILLVLAFASFGGPLAATAGDPGEPTAAQRQLLVAHADGSWLITEAIGEAPVPLDVVTRGLIREEKDEQERMAQTEAEEAAERAFEEAIEAARREPRR